MSNINNSDPIIIPEQLKTSLDYILPQSPEQNFDSIEQSENLFSMVLDYQDIPPLETTYLSDRRVQEIKQSAIQMYNEAIQLITKPKNKNDIPEAIESLQQSAQSEYPPALYLLSYFHLKGMHNLPKNEAYAYELLEKAARQGLEEAKLILEHLIILQTPQPYKDLAILAEQGDAIAQYNLGYAYLKGEQLTQDYQLAFEYLSKAAAQNHAKALFCLGYLYQKGYHVQKNIHQALEYFQKSADLGYRKAQHNCALLYKSDLIVEKDLEKAFMYFSKAAEQNFILSQFSLALCYEEGAGCEKNQTLAFKYYELAALSNHKSAQFHLGLCYMKGQGTIVDYQQALYWFKKASDQNHTQAKAAYEQLDTHLKTPKEQKPHCKAPRRPRRKCVKTEKSTPPQSILKRQNQQNQSASKKVRFSPETVEG